MHICSISLRPSGTLRDIIREQITPIKWLKSFIWMLEEKLVGLNQYEVTEMRHLEYPLTH